MTHVQHRGATKGRTPLEETRVAAAAQCDDQKIGTNRQAAPTSESGNRMEVHKNYCAQLKNRIEFFFYLS